MTCTSAMILAMLTITALRPGGSGRDARDTASQAENLIARALELRRAGHPSDALELFRRAHDRSPSPRTLGHMGLVETSLQLWSDADAHLGAALATPGDQWVRQNQAFLSEAQTRANMHVGELAVSGPPGTRLSIAGREMGRLPLRAPLRLAEGDVRITATSDGHKPFSVEVNIQGGRRAAVTVLLDPVEGLAPAPPAPPAVAPVDGGWHLDRRKWLGGGLAVAGAGVLTLGIGWLQVDGRCETRYASGACLQAYQTSGLGWLATGTGAAMLVAGGVVLVLASRPGASMGIAATPRSIRLEARF